MLERLKRTGRGAWLDQEMERISDPANYINDPALAWKKVKIQSRKPDVAVRLKALAGWRELEARSKNLPRGRIMKDETLADVALHPPASQEALGQVRGLSAAWKGNDIGSRMMEALHNATAAGGRAAAARGARARPRPRGAGRRPPQAAAQDSRPRTNVAAGRPPRLELLPRAAARASILEGWRYEEFGRDALDLVEGRLAFAIVNGKLVMTRCEPETIS